MHRNVTEKNVRHRALEDCKKAGVGPLAAMYVRSGYFIQRASCKPSRERMCLGAMSEGVCCARWTQIDAIARADVLCSPLEWRLPCQMIFRKRVRRACTAVYAKLGFFLQITARANVPWSDTWMGSRRSMDTNRCHRASRCALQAPRKAIAVPDDLREQGTEGYYDLRERGTPVHRRPSPNNKSPLQRTALVRDFAGRGYCYLAVEWSIRDIA